MSDLRVVNLDRSPERLQRFRHWNAHLGEVPRFAAVDGAALDRAALVEAGFVTEGLVCGAGSLGCAVSHIRLWEEAAHENRTLTIFEDDAIAAHGFLQAAARALGDLPADWDLIKWGFSGNMSAWFEIGLATAKVEWTWDDMRRDDASLRAFQAQDAPAAPVRMLNSVGLFAYSISPKGARAALAACLPLANRIVKRPDGAKMQASGIDALLSGAMSDMQAYAALPSLAVHADPGPSVRMDLDRA